MPSYTRLRPKYFDYNFPIRPNENDGLENLRLPSDWMDWATTYLYLDWTLFSLGRTAVNGEADIEKHIYLNAGNGVLFLKLMKVGSKYPKGSQDQVVLSRARDCHEQLQQWILPLRFVDEQIIMGRAGYVDGPEFERNNYDGDCSVCSHACSLKPTRSWRDKWPIPKMVDPDLVKYLPLGPDDQAKFFDISNQIWKNITSSAGSAPYIGSQNEKDMEACCRDIAAAFETYHKCSGPEKFKVGETGYTLKIAKRYVSTQEAAHSEGCVEDHVEGEGSEEGLAPEQAVVTECGHRMGIVCFGDSITAKAIRHEPITCPCCSYDISIGGEYVDGPWVLPIGDHEQYLENWVGILAKFGISTVPKSVGVARNLIINNLHD